MGAVLQGGVTSHSGFQRLYRAWLALLSPAAFDSRLNTNSGIPSGKHLENLVHDGTRMMVKSSRGDSQIIPDSLSRFRAG